MKFGPGVIGVIIAGGLGYVLEPHFRPALLPAPESADVESAPSDVPADASEPAPEVEPEEPVAVMEPEPEPEPEVAPAPDWVASLTPEQLPEKVKLLGRAVLPVQGSDEPMVLPAGVSVTPVRVEGGDLVISPFGGPMEGKVAVMSTDLVEVLGNKPPEPVAATPEPMPEVAVEEPVETEAPAAIDENKVLTDEEIVAVMQASVKAGEIKEFTFDQVSEWTATDERESGGESFQSGLASYRAETIFGVKNIQAQALIAKGKVVKWIWPKSGMEIK